MHRFFTLLKMSLTSSVAKLINSSCCILEKCDTCKLTYALFLIKYTSLYTYANQVY